MPADPKMPAAPAPTPARSRRVRTALATAIVLALAAGGLAACAQPPRCSPGRGAPCIPARNAVQRIAAFGGLGAWVDVYDWVSTGGRAPVFDVADLDELQAQGVTTVYIQSARSSRSAAILDQDRFERFIARAHELGMRIVSWYLPTHDDVRTDWLRLVIPVWLGVDGIVWDIEDTSSMKDVDERNRRLVELANAMRRNYPDLPMGAAVLPPVVTDVLNTRYWPRFPWKKLADAFDVWMPMSYWTNRKPGTEWRDAERYTAANIEMIRAHLDRPSAPVHPVGGIANEVTDADLAGFIRASKDAGAVGMSLYDAATSAPSVYDAFRKG